MIENRLLAGLSEHERARLAPLLRRVEMEVEQVVVPAGETPDWLYFPVSGIVSIVSRVGDHTVEVATVGNEGAVGVECVLGEVGMPFEAFVQVAGAFDCLPISAVEEGPLRAALLRYAGALIVQTGQLSACARMHPVERRLARWLLLAHDQLGRSRLPLTQQFIGQMLGVRRAAVGQVLGMLERAGMIGTRRGAVDVLDRAALQTAACPCYRIVREAQERALRSA